MASRWFVKGAEQVLDGNIAWDSDTIKVALVSSAYTPNTGAHDFWDDIVANVIGTPATLSGKSITGGVFDASDVTFPAVTGAAVGFLVVYKDTGVAGTSPVLLLFDTATGSPGLPVTPNGGDIVVTWDNGANKIVKIG